MFEDKNSPRDSGLAHYKVPKVLTSFDKSIRYGIAKDSGKPKDFISLL